MLASLHANDSNGPAPAGPAYTAAPSSDTPAAGSIDRALRRLALLVDAPMALLLRPRADHRLVTTIAAFGTADRFESRRLARAATTALLARSRDVPAPSPSPLPPHIDGAPVLLHWLSSGEDLALVVARRPGAADFSLADRAMFTATLAWVEDLVDLWWQRERGAARAAGLRAALGKSDVGAILLDRGANVVDANTAAERLLHRNTGLVRHGLGIAASHPDDAAALRMAIYATILADPAHSRTPRNLALRRGANQRPLLVAVLQPLRQPMAGLAAQDPAVLLLVVDPEAASTSVADACGLYGLTASETRLAEALCSGKTVAEAAASLNLQPTSVRTYLRRIFAKTGVVRQSGLIQLLTNSRIPAAPRPASRPAARPTEAPVPTRPARRTIDGRSR